MQCDHHCSEYKSCISPCEIETCDNMLEQGKDQKLCLQDNCVEGCAIKPCPLNEIYTNDSYTECISKSLCKPMCLQLNGIDFYEGDVTKSDNCQTCHCSKGKEICIGVPCDKKSILPYHIPDAVINQDASQSCKSGWSEWINQERASGYGKSGSNIKIDDREPLPNAFMLKNYKGSSFCDADFMKQIECRSVDSRLHPKLIGEDVECSLEKGLICVGQCHDYEIRVLCDCNDDIEIFTLPTFDHHTSPSYRELYTPLKIIEATTPLTPIEYSSICDPAIPHVEKLGSCHEFYHCTMNSSGAWVYVEKTCGNDMMFNPTNMICDHIANVKSIKPECGTEKIKENPVFHVYTEKTVEKCPKGKVWSECAVPCGRACHFYDKFLQQSGLCTGSLNKCEEGCVAEQSAINCAQDLFWRDDKLCVKMSDCTCRSDDGKIVKVRDIFFRIV